MAQQNYIVIDGQNIQRTFGAEDYSGVLAPWSHDQTTHLRLGNTTDTVAVSDTGGFSIIPLIKRALTHLSSILSRFPTALDSDGKLKTRASRNSIESTSGSISVGTSLTTVLEIDTSRYQVIGIQIENLSATALSAFEVQVRYNSSLGGFYNPRATSSADFNANTAQSSGNPMIPVIASSGNFPALAGSSSGWIEINCSRFQSLRFQARVASGSTNVRISGFLI